VEGPSIVIAGSGMCTGGRIIDHLKAGIGNRENEILFVGYQAKGTPGRDILKYSKKPGGYVVLDGERLKLKGQRRKGEEAQRSKVKGGGTEDGRLRTEDGGRRTEDSGWKTEDGGFRCLLIPQ